ncbi:hypothetical protein CHL78_005725 [Romboutsia weinsteinii]|uniref:PepSY domain-containing protein n=1 Tax=Romboutsia weinsteinii TaxID=2020949 RepID=A0A371J6M0_9FIRM|nr:hypothetical protein [Romboutsia weinsteinii]RDY28399.1 hypothetical protein CHL78_005725 [Romboutsia weinsteinii]
MMKNRIAMLISIAVILIIISFLIYNNKFSIKEGILYSQKDVVDYKDYDKEKSVLVSRQKAIDLALEVFKNGLDIEINSNDCDQYITIYKESLEVQQYKWTISWSRYNLKGSYICEIDAYSGKITSIFIYEPYNKETNNNELSKDDIIELIKKLTNQLDIDLNQYEITNIKKDNYGDLEGVFQTIGFTNKSDVEDKFTVTIDSGNKSIVEYQQD